MASGLCQLERVLAKLRSVRQRSKSAVRVWRRWNTGISLERQRQREKLQFLRICELQKQVHPMRAMVATRRRLGLSSLFSQLHRWRVALLQEVVQVWWSTTRSIRDSCNDHILELREEDATQLQRLSASIGALLGSSAQRIEQFVLEAWLRVAEHEKHEREVQAVHGELREAFAELQQRAQSCREVFRTVLTWLQQKGADVREVLRSWAAVAASSMQKKLATFRKLQAEAEITKLCLRTGEWIDSLLLRRAVKQWQREVLQQRLIRHSEQEERAKKLQSRLRVHGHVVDVVQGSWLDQCYTTALAHVCLGAWSVYSALRTAQQLTDRARQNSMGHHTRSLRMLSRTKALVREAVYFSLHRGEAGAQLCGWPFVARIFPLWRRWAASALLEAQARRQEAASLKLTEDLRQRTERHQEKWAHWAISQMVEHQNARLLQDAFVIWCDQQPAPPGAWRKRASHQRSLDMAEQVFVKVAKPLQVSFTAWKRVHGEEKMWRAEEDLRRLEGQLARRAGERGMSVPQLEERLAFTEALRV